MAAAMGAGWEGAGKTPTVRAFATRGRCWDFPHRLRPYLLGKEGDVSCWVPGQGGPARREGPARPRLRPRGAVRSCAEPGGARRSRGDAELALGTLLLQQLLPLLPCPHRHHHPRRLVPGKRGFGGVPTRAGAAEPRWGSGASPPLLGRAGGGNLPTAREEIRVDLKVSRGLEQKAGLGVKMRDVRVCPGSPNFGARVHCSLQRCDPVDALTPPRLLRLWPRCTENLVLSRFLGGCFAKRAGALVTAAPRVPDKWWSMASEPGWQGAGGLQEPLTCIRKTSFLHQAGGVRDWPLRHSFNGSSSIHPSIQRLLGTWHCWTPGCPARERGGDAPSPHLLSCHWQSFLNPLGSSAGKAAFPEPAP